MPKEHVEDVLLAPTVLDTSLGPRSSDNRPTRRQRKLAAGKNPIVSSYIVPSERNPVVVSRVVL
jgi:hypothetical protein